MPGHALCGLGDLAHSEVFENLLRLRLLLNLLLLVDLGVYFLCGDLFHSCWCLRFGLQRLALVQQVSVTKVHFFLCSLDFFRLDLNNCSAFKGADVVLCDSTFVYLYSRFVNIRSFGIKDGCD